MKTTLRGLAIAAATAALLGTTLPAQAAPTYEMRLGELERGPAPEVPVLVGTTIHDGDVRVPLDGYEYVRLLGAVDDSYVVSSLSSGDYRPAVARVDADGTTTHLAGRFDGAQLSDDGTRVAISREGRRRSLVRVLDTQSGDVLARRRLGPWTSVLDVDATRVVTSSWVPARTTLWRYDRDTTRVLRRHHGQFADLSSGVFAITNGDPYDDGCTEMARFRSPRQTTWRNCRERILDVSPGGTRVVTAHILADGPGPFEVHLRRTGGRKLATFRAPHLINGWTFEDDRDVLLEASGRRLTTWVRANEDGVERVTRFRRTPSL